MFLEAMAGTRDTDQIKYLLPIVLQDVMEVKRMGEGDGNGAAGTVGGAQFRGESLPM